MAKLDVSAMKEISEDEKGLAGALLVCGMTGGAISIGSLHLRNIFSYTAASLINSFLLAGLAHLTGKKLYRVSKPFWPLYRLVAFGHLPLYVAALPLIGHVLLIPAIGWQILLLIFSLHAAYKIELGVAASWVVTTLLFWSAVFFVVSMAGFSFFHA